MDILDKSCTVENNKMKEFLTRVRIKLRIERF